MDRDLYLLTIGGAPFLDYGLDPLVLLGGVPEEPFLPCFVCLFAWGHISGAQGFILRDHSWQKLGIGIPALKNWSVRIPGRLTKSSLSHSPQPCSLLSPGAAEFPALHQTWLVGGVFLLAMNQAVLPLGMRNRLKVIPTYSGRSKSKNSGSALASHAALLGSIPCTVHGPLNIEPGVNMSLLHMAHKSNIKINKVILTFTWTL